MKRRVLRSYERMADKFHTCRNCFIPIMPGDWYSARVVVYDNPHMLRVEKSHIGCPEDPDERRNSLDVEFIEEICEKIAA